MAEAPWRQVAAPPPPPGVVGHTPSQRLKSEASDRRVEPPLCVQNAMLTKDKKPFTYTPGGIDLSEIRSPRMQRRLELNAMNEGVAPLPQNQQQHHPTGPLPPSALAAMQPQLPVQVFPSGGIPQPHHHGGGGGGPPPPPPPPSNIPAPPRAPPMRSTSPLPVDAFERPDMTKIIPENPMALLRKTSGPVIKRDPIFNKDNYNPVNNQLNNVSNYSPQPPQPAQSLRQPESPQKTTTAGIGSIYVPPVNQNSIPSSPPNRQPQPPQFLNQRESSPAASRAPPAYYKRQPSTPQAEPQSPQSPQLTAQKQQPILPPAQREPQSPDSPKVSLSKAPAPWLQKRSQQQDVPEWAVNDHPAKSSPNVPEQKQVKQDDLQQYQQQSAPWRQQQQEPPQWQQRQQQEPEVQPWQQRPQQQPESQPWQMRQQQQPESQPWQRQQQQPESPPWQQRQQQSQIPPWQQQQQQQHQPPPIRPSQGGGVRKQIQSRDNPQESGPTERTEVVIVNEPPQVFQHPGPTQRILIRQQPQQNNYQQQQQRRDSPGARVIPVQMEGASSNGHSFNSPRTPGNNSDARSLNRQLSWNSNPTQSNTFRVLQKITNTDGDDDDDDEYQPITEHSPKMPQHFPQRQKSVEQVRKADQELMNKFKQVPQSQSNNTGPKVRTIPIQIEGDGPPKTYVPPSEQTTPEPKKYMGSSIPSRSFKILQAMTAPDDCGPGQSDY